MKSYKICLIVDNPLRDLDGLVLLGSILAKKDTDVFLVPMYTQGYEVPAICPDLVLMNYARMANSDFIKAYSDAGIMVGVLDTEGGVWESEEQYVKSINHKECAEYIDLYCLWGRTQYDALLEYTAFNERQLAVTGNPRYDFYSYPWINSLQSCNQNSPIIFIISNFSLAYPRFARTAGNEISNMIKAGYERNYVEERQRSELATRKKLIEVIKRLSLDFPLATIIIRPHPFENEKEYNASFEDFKNIQVIRKGTVAQWIKDASVVLHLNSSTAIDAFMMGKTAISLDWINNDTIRGMSALSYNVSYKTNNYNDLKKIVSYAINGDNAYLKIHNFDSNAKRDVEAWFHFIDGKASYRVAEAILKTIIERKKKPSRAKCRRLVLYGSRNPKSIKGWLDGIGRLIVGPNNYDFLRTWVLTRNVGLSTKHSKTIELSKVKNLLELLNQVENEKTKIYAAKISRKNAVVGRIAGSSICIYKKSIVGKQLN